MENGNTTVREIVPERITTQDLEVGGIGIISNSIGLFGIVRTEDGFRLVDYPDKTFDKDFKMEILRIPKK